MPFTSSPSPAVIAFVVRAAFLVGLATLSGRAEPMSTIDAQQLLRQAQTSGAVPGSFRAETTRKTKLSTITTTTLTRRGTAGPVFFRTESVTVLDRHPERTTKHVTIVNADGRWRIVGHTAVLMPPPFDIGKFIDLMNRSALDAKNGTAPSESATGKDAEWARRAITMGSHIQISGERVKEGERELAHVTRTYDEQARKFFGELAEGQLAEVKKQLSFVKRAAIGAYLATHGGIEAMLPAKEVFTIDIAANKLIKSETYNAAGKVTNTRGEAKAPEKIDDLPDATFSLPAGIEIVRPKTFVEANELVEKLEAEEKKKLEVAKD